MDSEKPGSDETPPEVSVTDDISNCPWLKFYKSFSSPWMGWTTSYDDVKQIITTFEMCTNTSFVREYKRKKGPTAEDCKNGHHVRYQDGRDPTVGFPELLQFDGIPFMNINQEKFECHRGCRVSRKLQKENEGKKRRPSFKGSKKTGCKAKILVRQITRFPEFNIEKNTKAKREFKSQKLRKALKENPDGVISEKRFYVYLPQSSSHNHDNSDDLIHLIIDDRVKDKIYELVSEGIESPAAIMKRLKEFVHSNRFEWFPNGELPEATNRRFFPSLGAIRCHKNRALVRDQGSRPQPQILMDSRVKERIYQLVAEGIESTSELKQKLTEFVELNRFNWFSDGNLPESSCKQFFPSTDAIRKHTKNALAGHRYSKVTPAIDSTRLQQIREAHKLRIQQINEALKAQKAKEEELEKQKAECQNLLDEMATAVKDCTDFDTLNEVKQRMEEIYTFLQTRNSEEQKRKAESENLVVAKMARFEGVNNDCEQIEVPPQYVTIVLAEDEINQVAQSEGGQILGLEAFNEANGAGVVENIILLVTDE